jgi:cupin fold WbuC family metalloprotein
MNFLTAQAKASPRLRMNYDLRNSSEDGSQRMLNALEPGTPLPIHRHMKSSETVVVLRGHLREIFYNDLAQVVEVIDLYPGGPVPALQIPLGQWHTVEVLDSGTVILECKDGEYEPLGEEDLLIPSSI